MPIYEYRCAACNRRFEAMRRMSERAEAPSCPDCGSDETELGMSTASVTGGSGGGGAGACSTSTWTGGG